MKKLNLIMVAAACSMVLALTGCGRSDSTLTADVCPLVVEIITANGQNNVSCNSLQNIQKIDNDHYSAIAEVTCDGKTEMLNINFPSEGSRGIRITRHGGLFYTDEFVSQGEDTYIHVGDPIREGKDLTIDIHAVVNGYVSITPLTAEKTDLSAFERFKGTTKSF